MTTLRLRQVLLGVKIRTYLDVGDAAVVGATLMGVVLNVYKCKCVAWENGRDVWIYKFGTYVSKQGFAW